MPFGLTNAPACFQQTIELAIAGSIDCARTYTDDVIIYTEDWMNHLGHIDKILRALKEAGLTVNPVKYERGGKQMLYLGHVVGNNKLAVPEVRTQAMARYIKQITKKGLKPH